MGVVNNNGGSVADVRNARGNSNNIPFDSGSALFIVILLEESVK